MKMGGVNKITLLNFDLSRSKVTAAGNAYAIIHLMNMRDRQQIGRYCGVAL